MNEQAFQKNNQQEMDILVWYVIKLLIKNKKQILEKHTLTCSQFEILSAIYHFPNKKKGIIQMDLSEKTNIDPATTSMILRNLQKKNLITRQRSPVNTRSILVELTNKGSDVLKKASLQIRKHNKLIYGGIDETQLTIQLTELSNNLNKIVQE